MIRINLLGQARPKPAGKAVPLESTLMVLLPLIAIIAAIVVLAIVYVQKNRELAAINQQIRSLQSEKARLEQVKAQVQQFEEERAVLQQRINVIETLQANRTGGQKLLQMVANTVGHTNALWLTLLSRKGNELDIEGEAGSIDSVANFITQMKRSGYFDKIEMKEAKENDLVKGVQTFGFTMTAEVSQPKLPAAGLGATPLPARAGRS